MASIVSPSPDDSSANARLLARQPSGPRITNAELIALTVVNANRRNSTRAQSRDLFGSGGANKHPVGSRNSARQRASFRALKKIEKEHASRVRKQSKERALRYKKITWCRKTNRRSFRLLSLGR